MVLSIPESGIVVSTPAAEDPFYWLWAFIRQIAKRPDDVYLRIDRRSSEYVLITIQAAAEDRGNIIGKNGKTMGDLRWLAYLVGQKIGRKVSIDLGRVLPTVM